VKAKGLAWFEGSLLPRFAPLTIGALLATLVFIFAFQADNIARRPAHVLLIAVPITPTASSTHRPDGPAGPPSRADA
jgi:ACR3 family arsenite transporter